MKNFKPFFKSASRALAALVLVAAVSTVLFAAAPAKINYQGKLTDSSGIPINVATNVEFAVENLAGVQQWTSGVVSVTPVNGVFNQTLDVPESILQANTELYLELRVAGTAMTPRQRLVAAPYALAVAAGAVGTTELDTANVDTRYATLGTVQTITAIKTISADWVNTANPWADNEVSDTLTVGAGGSVAASAIAAGALDSDVIASSVAVNSVTDSAIVSLSASKILAGALGPTVRASSVAVNSVNDSAIVGMSASKLTGALPALDGSALTGVTATGVGANSVGTTQIINSTVTLNDLDQTDVDSRYATLGTAQSFTGIKTLSANWVNTANPWADNEVSDILTVGAGSSVTASAIAAGALDADVIASSVAVNAVTTSQILNNNVALADLNTGDVDTRYVTTGTAQGITGLKTLTNGVIIGASGTEIAKYISIVSNEDLGNVPANTSSTEDIAVAGAAMGDAVIVTPPSNWPAGLFFNAFVNGANTVRLVLYNPTAAPLNPSAGDFRISVIQH